MDWANKEIENLQSDVDFLNKQLPLVESFVEWLQHEKKKTKTEK